VGITDEHKLAAVTLFLSAHSEKKKGSCWFPDCMGYMGQITFTKPGWETTAFGLTSGLVTPNDDRSIG
jgi:hypothetical protein